MLSVWLRRDLIEIIHAEQLAHHGSGTGRRDPGLLESALSRPLNRATYGEPDIAELATVSAIAICKNPPFVDGNKHTPYVALKTFLALNGMVFPASDAQSIVAMQDLAAGEIIEDEFTAWVRDHARPAPGPTGPSEA